MKHKKTTMTLLCLGLMLLFAGAAYAQSITVTGPAAGANWVKGQTYTILWTKTGSMDANVKIKLFDSTGATTILSIAEPTANSGSFIWTVPVTVAPASYKIRVRTMDNAVWDNSELFNIIDEPAGPAATITVNSPNASSQWIKTNTYNITWTKTGSLGANVRIRLFDAAMATVIEEISDNTPNDGSHSWTVPNTLAVGNYVIRVKDLSSPILGNSPVFLIKEDSGSGGIPDWGRIRDILEGLRELDWWRNRPPKFPWPNPCLSCPPEFDLGKIREHLERAGLKERIRVELFGQDGKISDLGVFGKGLSFGKSLRMKQIGQRQSELLQGGKGFKLVFRNMAGEIVHTQAINMKEMAQGVR